MAQNNRPRVRPAVTRDELEELVTMIQGVAAQTMEHLGALHSRIVVSEKALAAVIEDQDALLEAHGMELEDAPEDGTDDADAILSHVEDPNREGNE